MLLRRLPVPCCRYRRHYCSAAAASVAASAAVTAAIAAAAVAASAPAGCYAAVAAAVATAVATAAVCCSCRSCDWVAASPGSTHLQPHHGPSSCRAHPPTTHLQVAPPAGDFGCRRLICGWLTGGLPGLPLAAARGAGHLASAAVYSAGMRLTLLATSATCRHHFLPGHLFRLPC